MKEEKYWRRQVRSLSLLLVVVVLVVGGMVMMVLEVTWMCWRCSLGKSWAGTDNQSQSSLHHITAFPPGLTPAPLLPWSPAPVLIKPSEVNSVSSVPPAGSQSGAWHWWPPGGSWGCEISSWHHYYHRHQSSSHFSVSNKPTIYHTTECSGNIRTYKNIEMEYI